MEAVEERVYDQPVLKLLRAMLRAGVMESGQVRREAAGTPQGGVISPVMCNVYLHRLDREWDERDGVLCRYADDLVVMCWSRSQAEGFDFLGFRHQLVRSRGLNGKPRVLFLARWPADRAVRHARDRIRELTGRDRLPLPPEAVARDVNTFLRGWAGYFRFGHSARRFSMIRQYAWTRLSLFISKKHRRSRHFVRQVMLRASPRDLGLVSLYGIVVATRAGKPWRERPNAGGERRR